MLELIDEFCWEKNNKTITYDHHGISGLKNFAHWSMPTASRPTPLHHHSDIIEIHCLSKGKRSCHVQDKTYTITGNELFISFPFEPHYSSSNDLSPCSFYGMQIDVSKKDDLLGLNPEYSRALYDLLTTLNHRHLRFTTSDQKLLSMAFNNIGDNDSFSIMLGVQYLCTFLFKIPEFIPVRRESKSIRDENIKRVLEVIDRHFLESPNLKELAVVSGYSLSRFKVKFREVVGFPPANYITYKKLEYAKQQLADTEDSITQIALDSGFSSSNYFCTVFHNSTQYTPSEFRKACRDHKSNPSPAG
ncbi:MAG: AraC family transcriptional regulator [Spirochaetales bacterium]|nr:AraC family transcriptional regulator [Spirochaetales bacterium]